MTRLQRLRPFLLKSSKNQYNRLRFMSNNKGDKETTGNDESLAQQKDKKFARPMYVPETPSSIEDVDEPTNCCMSGCPNCVWIEYAEKLSKVLKDSPGDIQKVIMDKVQDPNMRAFLSMELRVRKLIE